jgi:hypothetical protein
MQRLTSMCVASRSHHEQDLARRPVPVIWGLSVPNSWLSSFVGNSSRFMVQDAVFKKFKYTLCGPWQPHKIRPPTGGLTPRLESSE